MQIDLVQGIVKEYWKHLLGAQDARRMTGMSKLALSQHKSLLWIVIVI